MFEPFFTTKPVRQGTGLGLAQVKAMCQSAGGDARIGPSANGGTWIRLFFAQLPRQAAETLADAPDDKPLSLRILLVDDNAAVADAMQQLLATMGCTVECVGSGEAALALLDEQHLRFDVVISDIQMPSGMDGVTLAARLLERRPALPVVLVTGYALRLDQVAAQGFVVVPKPCTPSVLRSAVVNAMSVQAGELLPSKSTSHDS